MSWGSAVPAICTALIGGYVGAVLNRRATARAEKQRRMTYFSDDTTSGGWESVIYDIRDWANETQQVVLHGVSLRELTAAIRCPGEHTLRYLVDHDRVPSYALPRFLILLEYCALYNRAMVECLVADPPVGSAGRRYAAELADHVADIAQEIVHGKDLAYRLHKEHFRHEYERFGRLRHWLRNCLS